MKRIFRTIIIICLIIGVCNQYRLASMNIVPVGSIIQGENPTKKKLDFLGVKSNTKLVDAINFASEQNQISTDLIIALTFTESNFNSTAISSKGYKGLMQIPQPVYYSDANILIGTRILREKINITKGDVEKAICLYKGYPIGSERGKEQVKKVVTLYHKIKNYNV